MVRGQLGRSWFCPSTTGILVAKLGSSDLVTRLLPAESLLNPSVLRAFHVLINTLQGATSSA